MRHKATFQGTLILLTVLFAAGCGGGGWEPPVGVSVSPRSVQTVPGAGVNFTSVVSGTSNTEVTWRVLEGPPGGAIVSFGRYLAPALAGTYHVVATSKANPSKSGQATITVRMLLFTETESVNVNRSESRALTATLLGASNRALHWSVQEGASGGTITQDGLYTAPDTLGTYHVIIVSEATPQQTATLKINVVDRPSGVFP